MNRKTLDFDLRDLSMYRDFIKDTDNFDLFRNRLNSMDLSPEERFRYERHAKKYLVLNLYKKARDIATYMEFTRMTGDDKVSYLEDSTRMADLHDVIEEGKTHARELGLSNELIQDAVSKLRFLIEKRKEHYISLSETFRTKNKNGNGNAKTENGNGGGN